MQFFHRLLRIVVLVEVVRVERLRQRLQQLPAFGVHHVSRARAEYSLGSLTADLTPQSSPITAEVWR